MVVCVRKYPGPFFTMEGTHIDIAAGMKNAGVEAGKLVDGDLVGLGRFGGIHHKGLPGSASSLTKAQYDQRVRNEAIYKMRRDERQQTSSTRGVKFNKGM